MVKRALFKIPENVDIIMEIYYKGLGDHTKQDKVRKTIIELLLSKINESFFNPAGFEYVISEEDVGRILTHLFDDFSSDWGEVMQYFNNPNDLEDIVGKLLNTLTMWINDENEIINIIISTQYWEIERMTGDYFILKYT